VTARVATPVMADESAFSFDDVTEIIRRRAADIVNIKLMKTGGISNALRIADLCAAHDVQCMMGSMLETSISVAAAAHVAVARAGVITRVDLDGPELTVFVEILKDRVYVSLQKLPGPGGFPVGTAGRVVALLSGGIDSPVAVWRMMKRGCTVVPVHFHAFPLLDHTTIDKARDLARILARFQYRVRLLLAPFGAVQQTIVASCPAPLRVVLYRRFMVRIAEELARRHRAKALVTGESLGQVASQTLDNMTVIDEAARGPVLRPLVGMDKDEIVAEAKRIGTFETSTLPDQDCCQLFVPRHPATAAHIDEVRKAEEALDVVGLVHRCVVDTQAEVFVFPGAEAASGGPSAPPA